MRSISRRVAIAAVVIVSISIVATGVIAATQSSDEAALAPTRGPANRSIERKVNKLVSQMTLKAKLEQLTLLPDFEVTDAEVKNGLGSILSITDPATIRRYQEMAVNQGPAYRLNGQTVRIPLLFAFDTIHGFRTIFPIPLAEAASFDPSVGQADTTYGARESTAVGLKQAYAPMVDVSHEPRWGRISEGSGEDPYLGSVMAAAKVKGFQGTDYSATDREISSPKHFAAYGQPEGGRDYNTTDMSLNRLWNYYLPPFKAAIDAGADTAMCSFNSINGSPGCANRYLMTDTLKRRWGFDGFVESDWAAVAETRACPPQNPPNGDCGHGTSADGPDAAAQALNAGMDSEMTSTFIRDFGQQLVSSGRVSMSRINDAVKRILRVKFRAGLFEHPYGKDATQADAEKDMLQPDAVAAARDAGSRSMVLLKNDDNVLPFDPSKKTAVIGPLAKDLHNNASQNGADMLGPWWGVGRPEDAVTVFNGIDKQSPGASFAEGCRLSNDDSVPPGPDTQAAAEGCQQSTFPDAVAAANAADQVVLAVGETREMGGEAESRSNIDLPGNQEELIREVVATGKPVAIVLFNNRPLALENIIDAKSASGPAPAWLDAWFPGVQAGNSVADVVFGKVNPGGKLPVSFPVRLGQVPIYYNHEPTGRPCDPTNKYNSRYRDLGTCDPLFKFGYGLSYTTFKVSNLQLSSHSVSRRGSVRVSMDVTNTGSRKGDDVAQLYIHDPVASISQPVRRLRGFQRLTLDPGQTQTVTFTLDSSDFGFYDNLGKFVVEPGQIDVFGGDSSAADLTDSFTVH
jgi:beta-glucosidase